LPSLIAVMPPGHFNCVVCGWHFESRLSHFSTRLILPLPLVDRSVSPLGALPGVHYPTNLDGFINAVSTAQFPPSSKTNKICVGLTSVPQPLIYSIPTSSVAAANLFQLEVFPLPSIYLLGNRCCRCHRPMLSSRIQRQIKSVVGGCPLADTRQRIDVVGLVTKVSSFTDGSQPSALPQPSPPPSPLPLPPPPISSKPPPSSPSSPSSPSTPSSTKLPV